MEHYLSGKPLIALALLFFLVACAGTSNHRNEAKNCEDCSSCKEDCKDCEKSGYCKSCKDEARGTSVSLGSKSDGCLSTMPIAPASFGAAVAGNYLYLLGGHIGKTHQHSIDNLQNRFYRMDLDKRLEWEEIPGGVELQSVSLLEWNDNLYRIGGLSARNRKGQPEDLWSVADFARYDFQNERWQNFPSLPHPRSSGDAFIVNDKLYILGGWKMAGPDREWPETGYVYDLTQGVKGAWEEFSTPFRRRAIAATSYQNKLYVFGGLRDKGGVSSELDIYDPLEKTWSKGPELPFYGFGASALEVNGRLYASGLNESVYVLSKDGKSWEESGNLFFPRFFHRMVKSGENECAFVGGASQQGHIPLIEWMDFNQQGASLRMASLEMPFPGESKNRQAMLNLQEGIYLSGGNRKLQQHDFDPESFSNKSYIVKPAALKVESGKEFPVHRQSLKTIMISQGEKDFAFAFGGFGNSGDGEHTQDGILKFNPKKERWQELETVLPQSITQFGICEYDEKVWLFGGLHYDKRRAQEEAFQHSKNIFIFDPETESISTGEAQLPRTRRAFGGTLLNNRFYLVGGMRENFEPVKECDVYNFAKNQWESIPSPSQVRISPELIAFENELWLLGGSSRNAEGKLAPNRSLEVFDFEKSTWTTKLEEIPNLPSHAQVSHWGKGLIIFSTHNEEGRFKACFLMP